MCLQDAAELLHFGAFPDRSAIVVISRSGQSVEIMILLANARESRTLITGLTNSECSPLLSKPRFLLPLPSISITGVLSTPIRHWRQPGQLLQWQR